MQRTSSHVSLALFASNMTIKDLRTKSTVELAKMQREMKAERMQIEFALFAGQERNVRKLRNLKRDIARVETCLTQLGQTATK